MSVYAKQAVIAAASNDDSYKARLQDPEDFQGALEEILSLTEEELADLQKTVSSEDFDEVVEDAEERNNPGPGMTGMA